MTAKWINTSKMLIKELKRLEETKEQDRLDLVKSIHLTLYALQRSLMGWMELVINPDRLTPLTHEDLEDVNKLLQFSHSFIEYNLEATNLGTKKCFKTGKQNIKEDRQGMFYV